VLEELGMSVSLRPALGGVIEGDWDFKHEALSWFVAPWPGGRGSYDPVEIAEVRWFSVHELPSELGVAAKRVLAAVGRPMPRRSV
jgi:hypothetical protein